jgi:hypothetical protein
MNCLNYGCRGHSGAGRYVGLDEVSCQQADMTNRWLRGLTGRMTGVAVGGTLRWNGRRSA